MKRRTFRPAALVLFAAMLLLLSACDRERELSRQEKRDYLSACTEAFSGGSGTEQDPYRIETEQDLRRFGELCTRYQLGEENRYAAAHYRLEQDIRLGKKWTPVAEFRGVFDGNGHSISALAFAEREQKYYYGLFGTLKGRVENLSIAESGIRMKKDSSVTGTIAGSVDGGALVNCHAAASVRLDCVGSAGGLAGRISGSGALAEDCSSAAAVCSTGQVGAAGGLAARANAEIRRCVNTGTVSSQGTAGGIAAVLGGHVYDVRNEGAVSARKSAGGICCSFDDASLNSASDDESICLVRCVNTGEVSSETQDAAGICAVISGGEVTDSSNAGTVSAKCYAGGVFAFFQASAFGSPAETCRIRGCGNSGELLAADGFACGGIGGFIHLGETHFIVEDCVNTGKLLAPGCAAGGILGEVSGQAKEDLTGSLTVLNCRNSGPVTSEKRVCGGIVGELVSSALHDDPLSYPADFENCLSTGELRGKKDQTGGVVGYVSWGVEPSLENCRGEFAAADGTAVQYEPIGGRYTAP